MKNKAVKASICILLSFLLAVTSVTGLIVFAADVPTITVETVTIEDTDDNAEVKVDISNNPGVTSVRLHMSYDTSALELVEVVDGGILGTKNHPGNLATYPYILSWINDTAHENFTTNGTIATLRFKLKEGVAPGSYKVSVSYDNENDDICNVDIDTVDFSIVNGEVIVSSTEPPTYTMEPSTDSTVCSLPPVSIPTEQPTSVTQPKTEPTEEISSSVQVETSAIPSSEWTTPTEPVETTVTPTEITTGTYPNTEPTEETSTEVPTQSSTTYPIRKEINSLRVSLEGFEFYDDEYMDDVLGNSNVKLIVNDDELNECFNDGSGTFINQDYAIKAIDYQTEIITVDDDDMLHVTLFFDDTTYEWHVEPKIDFNLEYRGETDPSFTWTGEAVFIKKPNQDSFDSDIDMTGAELSIELDIPDKNISEHRTLIFGDNFEEQFNDEEYKTLVYSFTGYSEGDYSIYIDDINANYFYMSVFLNLKSGDSLLINMEDVRFPFSKTSFINAAEEEGLIIGDASLDQSVNVTDASIIQLITASSIMPTLAQQYCADVNGDRIVDIIDATFVQMYTANKISIFPAEEKENSSITVNSTSNFFGDDSCIVDASDDKVTLTYYLNIPEKEMVNAQWYLYYDSNILKFDDSNGSIGDFEEYTDSVFCGAPKRVYCEDYGSSSTTMVTIKKDKILGTTSEDANSYPLSLDGKEIPFISVTFKILDNTARETSVSLDMYVMSLKASNALGFSYFINDSKIVNNSVVYQSRTDIYSGGENKRCLLLSDCIENDSFDYGFNAWEHVEENTRILSALVCEDAYAEGASLRFGTYLFHANCEDVDLKQLIGKRINAGGVFCSQATEVGNDNDHYDIVDEIEFTISDLEIVDGKEESVSYMVIDSEFDADEFIVGRMYEFDNAQIEFTDSAFDILHYDTLDDTVLCHFNYTISSQYYFNHSEIEKQYNNQQLICFGVCRGMESKKYIDIFYIDNE